MPPQEASFAKCFSLYIFTLGYVSNLKKYNKGSDEFYYREIEYETYDKVCPKIKVEEPDKNYSICTLGQMHHLMERGWTGWWTPYFSPYGPKNYKKYDNWRQMSYYIPNGITK